MAAVDSSTALVDLVARDPNVPDAELSTAEYRRRRLLRFVGEFPVDEAVDRPDRR